MSWRLESLPRVGYWCRVDPGDFASREDDALPDPRTLVDPTWDPAIRSQVASYLKQRAPIWCWCGDYSYCRFHCGIPREEMGSCELTDGVWVWPQGLAHYVEVHCVRLPTEFLDHLQELEFRFPTHFASDLLNCEDIAHKALEPPTSLLQFYDKFARDMQEANRSLPTRLWHRLTRP